MNRIFCLLAILLLALSVHAQEKSTYLAEIQALREKHDVTFVYDASLRLDQTCAPARQQGSLSRALRDLFKGSGIDYEIRGHTVILRKHTPVGNPDSGEAYYKPIVDTLPPSRVEASWRDTLRAAVITDSRRTELSLGHLQTGLEEMRAVVSPMGEGDPIRWAQGLPGVTTGADGTTVILQSGHWENGAAETYPMHVPGGVWMADYYSGVNNYHMPTVFRLDLGWQKSFTTGRVEHTVNVGVCNVTNHFNPFMLYFDTSTESWKEIALLPVLPNFSWRVEF